MADIIAKIDITKNNNNNNVIDSDRLKDYEQHQERYLQINNELLRFKKDFEQIMKISPKFSVFNNIYAELNECCSIDIQLTRRIEKYYMGKSKFEDILKVRKDGDIIVYVDICKRYLIFHNYQKYIDFVLDMQMNCNTYNLYQVILSDEKQKLIFCFC